MVTFRVAFFMRPLSFKVRRTRILPIGHQGVEGSNACKFDNFYIRVRVLPSLLVLQEVYGNNIRWVAGFCCAGFVMTL